MKLLLAAVALAALIHQGTSINCYYCTNNSAQPNPVDPNCSTPDYADPNFIHEWADADGCRTAVYTDGTVERGGAWGHPNGECHPGWDHTTCYCTGELCNNQFCDWADCENP
ncbi:unnamed protein product [Meganyctiphanes norvegica]|uniref:Protein sleepless n=1 Tax=Meganyctiphanes norvegica TaxID=48144 RepID=A0AAV2QP80_MEGNR